MTATEHRICSYTVPQNEHRRRSRQILQHASSRVVDEVVQEEAKLLANGVCNLLESFSRGEGEFDVDHLG